MASLNKVTLIGHLGKDPEIRATQGGDRVGSFTLATSEKWTGRDGVPVEKTEWHRVVVFNDQFVKLLEDYVHKGSMIYVEGSLQTRKWTDQSGQERYVTEIVLGKFNSTFKMLDKRADNGGDRERRPAAAKPGKEYAGNGSELDDEIPF